MISGDVTTNTEGFNYLRRGNPVYRAIRIGANRAAAIVKERMVAEAPRKFGYLAKSLRIKIILHRPPRGGITAIVGPGSKIKFKKGKYKRGARKGESRVFRPARYAHMAERKYKFVSRTHDATAARFVETLRVEINNELQKAAAMVNR